METSTPPSNRFEQRRVETRQSEVRDKKSGALQAGFMGREAFSGAAAEGATARVLFVAPDGQKVTASDNRATIEKTAR